MGCGCGKVRRAFGGVTSAQTGQALSPQEIVANAVANAQGLAYSGNQQPVPSAGDDDRGEVPSR